MVAEPLLELGTNIDTAYNKIKCLFSLLNFPQMLWQLSPTTFSAGGKPRVNIARALAVDYPILWLHSTNPQVIVDLLAERKQ